MAEFMMLMKGRSTEGDWEGYVNTLVKSGKFRGGSSLSNGFSTIKGSLEQNASCVVTGFMRFEATDIEEVRELLTGNPVYESGGEVEIQELVEE